MENRRHYIGVDLGGTKIASALVDDTLQALRSVRLATQAEEGADAVMDRIVGSVLSLAEQTPGGISGVCAIGIGAPGPLNHEAGIVDDAPNLRWRNVPVTRILSERLGRPVYLENDANAAALAENRMGAGRGTRHMMYVTVSTGIGSGLVLNGKVFHGATGGAGELGHTTMLADGPMCGCGNRGCLEALASGTAIARRGREVARRAVGSRLLRAADGDLSAIDAALIARVASEGDPAACAILKSAFEYLGTAIANVVNMLNLEMVVIGGGVAQVGDILFDTVRQTVALRAFSFMAKEAPIVPASLGADVGVYGAACYAMEKHGEKS
ncbi:MAG: ROK family protein [Clostridia bacterium]|nr:ROK family protein [Clostridia bacterium]